MKKRSKPIARRTRPKKKRTSPGTLTERQRNPYSTYWEQKADELWPLVIKARANNRCEKCGLHPSGQNLNAHHLITRERKVLKHLPECGISLCAGCHKFNPGAPHSGLDEWKFTDWLQQKQPLRWEWMQQHRDEVGRPDFKEAYDRLMESAIELGIMGEVV